MNSPDLAVPEFTKTSESASLAGHLRVYIRKRMQTGDGVSRRLGRTAKIVNVFAVPFRAV